MCNYYINTTAKSLKGKIQGKSCVVNSIALCFDLPYDYVLKIAKGYGYTAKNGTPRKDSNDLILDFASHCNYNVEIINDNFLSVKDFINKYYNGKFLISCYKSKGHLTFINDGIITDWLNCEDYTVRAIYKLTKMEGL